MPDKGSFPPQHQERQPALESRMKPKPHEERHDYVATGKLQGKVALITGADSGIGRAIAILYAKEGADISVVYYDEHEDAKETKKQVEQEKVKCLLLPGDVGSEESCRNMVRKTVNQLGSLDILVNNAGIHFPKESIEEISAEQLERTFRTNIFSMFYLTKAALEHMKGGGIIINTASVTAYAGHPTVIDYAASKGAVVAFTRSMALSLADKDIRVNAVAPGPVWTPLITSFPADEVKTFGDVVV